MLWCYHLSNILGWIPNHWCDMSLWQLMYSINVFGCVIIDKHFAVVQMYQHITSSVYWLTLCNGVRWGLLFLVHARYRNIQYLVSHSVIIPFHLTTFSVLFSFLTISWIFRCGMVAIMHSLPLMFIFFNLRNNFY